MESFTYQAGIKALYGGNAIKNDGLPVKAQHLLRNFEVFELSDISPNLKIERVGKGVKLYRENKIDIVLVLEGESISDCAESTCPPV